MKKVLSATLLSLILAAGAGSLHAQQAGEGLGIGVMVGEPTGLSFKSWTGGGNAFDLGVAWSVGPYDALHLHADYLWHSDFGDVDEGALMLYVGLGGRMIFADDDARVGLRVPLGITYLFEGAPLDLFLEVAPVMNLVPGTDLDMTGTAGVRIYL
ncbi:MAG: hypothetical protein U5K31_07100 [Balneolaceae bacterium]|nr:hypothetical protein [Balneolaceae bacterium]